ncbi:hypothetical protein [Paenibacillus agricola]|uniref:Uncharacterized protein n=1 Tax=Paenibacillus agricola TaxID=2716264 RepID=A0ABX0JM82_9BACL|nr:hypothetical protein [Paenibacillus agricola]NHN35516.1 hypothetical protein [Paenibacillus agricola]
MISAAFLNGDALILVLSHLSGNGRQLVQIDSIKSEIIVTHRCGKSHIAHECSCVKQAVSCFREWRWWVKHNEIIILVNEDITLQVDWEQIPVPNSLLDIITTIALDGGIYSWH